MPTPPGQSAFRLRITLDDVVPMVWRRLLVPGSVHLAKLHRVFQTAMGWTAHLHSCTIGGQLFGMHFDDYPGALWPVARIRAGSRTDGR